MDKINLIRQMVKNILLSIRIPKIFLFLAIFVIFIFFSGKPAYADCCCDSGGYRIGTACYGITCSSPHFTCLCACPGEGGGGGGWDSFSCDIANCPTSRRFAMGVGGTCGDLRRGVTVTASADATSCNSTITSGTTVNYQFIVPGQGYYSCVNQVNIDWGDDTEPSTIWSSGGERCVIDPAFDETFNFSHTYTNSTGTDQTYTAHVNFGTQTENADSCSRTHTFFDVFCLQRTVNPLDPPPPLPPLMPICAYGPQLVVNPSLASLTGWNFYNNGNTSYSFISGIARLTSAGGNPVGGGFTQQIAGLAGKRVFYKAALRRKGGGSASNPYVNIGILHSPGTWEWNYPAGSAYYPSSSDTWEIVGNSTSILIPNDITRVMPAGNIWNAAAGDYYVGWISMCEEEPRGIITGSVINDPTNGYLMSTGAVCTPGTVVPGLTIGIEEGDGEGVTPADINQCAPAPVHYTKILFAALTGTKYTVTANVPAGWEALSWACTSWIGGVSGGTSCPTTGTEVGPDWANGTIAEVGNPIISLKANEEAHIWFYIQPIAPTCTITGAAKVSLGSTWWGSATTIAEGLSGMVGNADTQIGKSSSLAMGTPLGLTGLGSSPVQCSGSRCTISRSWIPTDADVGNTYNFYCRGFNYDASFSVPIRQCRPFGPWPYAYPSDIDCDAAIDNVPVLDSCTGGDCIAVEVTDSNAWFQVQGGDVYGKNGVTSYVPVTATNPMFNLDLDTYPGLISYSPPNTYDFHPDITNDGLLLSSSKKWLAQSGFSSSISNFYTYFVNKLKNSITAENTLTSCDGLNPPNSRTNVYLINGSCAIGSVLNVGSSAKVIVLVSGNLNITGNNTKITVATGGFLTFIVQGNISVDDNLGNKQLTNIPFIEGVYIADGTIITGTASNMSGNRFIGGGSFYGKTGVDLGRDLKPNGCLGHACNTYIPAEMFIFRPDLVINAPYQVWESKIDWQEVAP